MVLHCLRQEEELHACQHLAACKRLEASAAKAFDLFGEVRLVAVLHADVLAVVTVRAVCVSRVDGWQAHIRAAPAKCARWGACPGHSKVGQLPRLGWAFHGHGLL